MQKFLFKYLMLSAMQAILTRIGVENSIIVLRVMQRLQHVIAVEMLELCWYLFLFCTADSWSIITPKSFDGLVLSNHTIHFDDTTFQFVICEGLS